MEKQPKNRELVKRKLLFLAGLVNIKELSGFADYIGEERTKVYGWVRNGNIADTGAILAKFPKINRKWLTGTEENIYIDAVDNGWQQKTKATIEPGNEKQRSKISLQSKRPTQTDPCLMEVVQWMDEYFTQYPHQTPAFSREMAEQWDSFRQFLEKKGNGGGVDARSQAKVSNSD